MGYQPYVLYPELGLDSTRHAITCAHRCPEITGSASNDPTMSTLAGGTGHHFDPARKLTRLRNGSRKHKSQQSHLTFSDAIHISETCITPAPPPLSPVIISGF